MMQKNNDVIQVVEDEMELEETVIVSAENDDVNAGYGKVKKPKKVENLEKLDPSSIKIRKNFQETAFFYPHLTTDKDGNVSFNFTIPEALTRWKLQLLAHTKELASATKTLTT